LFLGPDDEAKMYSIISVLNLTFLLARESGRLILLFLTVEPCFNGIRYARWSF